jgi:hypothetical protein
MNSDIFPIYDKHLPGRDPSEEKALEKFARAIVSAERKLLTLQRARPSTHAGQERKLERLVEQRGAIADANDALVSQLKALGEKRAALLPVDAEDVVHIGRESDDHSMDRYKVFAHSVRSISGGAWISAAARSARHGSRSCSRTARFANP